MTMSGQTFRSNRMIFILPKSLKVYIVLRNKSAYWCTCLSFGEFGLVLDVKSSLTETYDNCNHIYSAFYISSVRTDKFFVISGSLCFVAIFCLRYLACI